ncbi:protein NO VEIN domain-containing protein [Streptomyces sp. NPDC096152]|uniref:protein NO VEIN domain-containing protein n=1 Tax=Streptomyces sp. NPDC096152 TaxID=3366078 RepID=UPI0038241E56
MAKTPRITVDNLGGWILRCNPDVYDLPGEVENGETKVCSWLVANNYRTELMGSGQRVVLWVGGPVSAAWTVGVWGIGYVTGQADVWVADFEGLSEYWLDEQRATRLKRTVPLNADILPTPVSAHEIRAIPELAGMELFRAQQMSNPIYVSPEEMAALETRLGPWPEYPGDAPLEITLGGTGAAFGDPLTNAVVEGVAMNAVLAHYEERGWSVSDVSDRKCGWDVTCTAPGRGELHLEVKGISGTTLRFLLTANEYRTAAADSAWRLVAVTDALGTRPAITELTAAEVMAGSRPMTYQYCPTAHE